MVLRSGMVALLANRRNADNLCGLAVRTPVARRCGCISGPRSECAPCPASDMTGAALGIAWGHERIDDLR